MTAVVLHVGPARAEWWRRHMQKLLPDMVVSLWDQPVDESAVEAAIVWRHPPGGLLRFPNLRVIISIGAGVDHVLVDPDLPPGVPIIRTTGPDLTQRMREYVVMHALRLHRGQAEIEAAQREGAWRQSVEPVAADRRIGVLGLGNLGLACARALRDIGFSVSGWSRNPRALRGVDACFGPDGLARVARRSDILVCLLPLTPETENILNARLFDWAPRGAAIINAARGEHLNEADLLERLDSGHLSRAVLDVFRKEPLPQTHPFWTHPKIDITPHVASLIDPEAGGRIIAQNLRLFLAGMPTPDLVDPARGY